MMLKNDNGHRRKFVWRLIRSHKLMINKETAIKPKPIPAVINLAFDASPVSKLTAVCTSCQAHHHEPLVREIEKALPVLLTLNKLLWLTLLYFDVLTFLSLAILINSHPAFPSRKPRRAQQRMLCNNLLTSTMLS